jgi:hypothetical protein
MALESVDLVSWGCLAPHLSLPPGLYLAKHICPAARAWGQLSRAATSSKGDTSTQPWDVSSGQKPEARPGQGLQTPSSSGYLESVT